jgi:hypothetical protein
MASCQLMQAAFVRLPYLGANDLFYPALDALIVIGMILLQAWATYLERVNPNWWQAATRASLGV